jgi:subtilisin
MIKAVSGRYIVQFRSDVDVKRATDKITARNDAEVEHVFKSALKGFSGLISDTDLESLKRNRDVLRIEPDLETYALDQTLPVGVDRIDADLNSFASIDGLDDRVDVDIAILDSGADLDHPDLNVFKNVNCSPGPYGGLGCKEDTAHDFFGHGTHVAGIAGALDNDFGVVGVAPGARLWVAKVLNNGGIGRLSWLLAGIDWVTENAADIEVVNLSLGIVGNSSALRTAIQGAVDLGVVFVAAAGNGSEDIYGDDLTFGTGGDDVQPASFPEVVAVSALADSDGQGGGTGPATSFGDDDTLVTFLNFSTNVVVGNPVNSPGAAIDFAAPGMGIYSTWPGADYNTKNGTSMASPHVAGAVALYIAENGRAYTAADVAFIRQAMINSADSQTTWGPADTGDPDSNPERLVNVGP